LRKLFAKLKDMNDSKTRTICELETLVANTKAELHEVRNRTAKGHEAPSLIPRRELARTADREVALPGVEQAKLYSEALRGKFKQKRYTLTVTSKESQPPDKIKGLLKSKINPTDIKVGINSLNIFRDGRVQIETGSSEEIETLTKDINDKCGDKLEVNVHKLRNPRLVIHNIPEDNSIRNIEDTLLAQNQELSLKTGYIAANVSYETMRRTRNLVIEVSAQTRKLLIKRKVKLGWQICSIEDYLVANRCFKCSRFNHRFRECRGTETCPLCAESHRLKECTVQPADYKCINCQTFNTHNKKAKISENHSSLDRNCPSLQAVLEKCRQNTDY